MKHFNGHDLKTGDAVRVTAKQHFPEDRLITHVCARFIHVGGKLFWKTSGIGANAEAIGYKLERVK
jgi:hypothetical protein